MIVYEESCAFAGLDPDTVASLARRLDRAARDARALGITVFGGSGSGDLRVDVGDGRGPVILANLDGSWDGGDGGCREDGDGHLRGETRRGG